jgi:Polyketide cyclase / dehydrase and lipid transport
MAVLTSSVELPLSPEEVWEGVIDLDGCSQWMTLHDGFPEGPPGKLRPGLVFKENVRFIGMPGDVTWTVAEFDKPKRIQLDGRGPLGVKLRAVYRLASSGEGTRLSYESEFGGLALRAVRGKVEKNAQAAGEESLERFRAMVTGDGAPTAPR